MIIDLYLHKVIIPLFFATASFFYLSGCATLEPHCNDSDAYRNALLERCYYRPKSQIQSVKSAIKHENSDILICVRLSGSGDNQDAGLRTRAITLPLPKSSEKISYGANYESSPFEGGSYCNWYPVKKIEICNLGSNTVSSNNVLPIEQLHVDFNDQNELYRFLKTYNKNQQITEKIYEVRGSSSDFSSLVYWPIQNERNGIPPILINGVCGEESGKDSEFQPGCCPGVSLLINFVQILLILF